MTNSENLLYHGPIQTSHNDRLATKFIAKPGLTKQVVGHVMLLTDLSNSRMTEGSHSMTPYNLFLLHKETQKKQVSKTTLQHQSKILQKYKVQYLDGA